MFADYMKTVIAGLQTWVYGESVKNRPDLNVNDPDAPGYVNGRTHYTEEKNYSFSWDGNTDGLPTVDFYGATCYRIGEYVSIDTLIGTKAVIRILEDTGGEIVFTIKESNIESKGSFAWCYTDDDQPLFFLSDGSSDIPEGLYIPQDWPIELQAIQPGVRIHPISKDYLPPITEDDLPYATQSTPGILSYNDIAAIPLPNITVETGVTTYGSFRNFTRRTIGTSNTRIGLITERLSSSRVTMIYLYPVGEWNTNHKVNIGEAYWTSLVLDPSQQRMFRCTFVFSGVSNTSKMLRYEMEYPDFFTLNSSTSDSTKKFKITVDDTGELCTTDEDGNSVSISDMIDAKLGVIENGSY